MHRDPEQPGDERDERPLAHDGEEHDDEDDLVDALRAWDAADHGKGREEDRNRPLEPAPGDEDALAQRRWALASVSATTRGRATSASTSRRAEHRPNPDAERPQADGQAKGNEHHDLGERRERGVKALDLSLVGQARIAEHEPRDEDGEEARAVHERRGAVENAGERQGKHGVEALGREPQTPQQRQERQAPARPIAVPIPISTTNSRTTTNADASSWVASSISPSISAIPAGSLTPASPSSVVPERPAISRRPRTENITAGSVGASAAPMRPASVQ